MIQIRKRILEIDEQLEDIRNNKSEKKYNNSIKDKEIIGNNIWYEEGITIIIPIYNGNKFIKRLIHSLDELIKVDINFEILFVLNGSEETIKNDLDQLVFNLKQSTLETNNYTILYSQKGPGFARNVGIENSKYSHTLLLDCDDTLHPNTLKLLSKYLHSTTEIKVFNIKDVIGDLIEKKDNVIQKEKNKFLGQRISNYINIPKIISINGAKLIPTHMLSIQKYDTSLKSGEDIELMMRIIALYEPVFNIINESECIYYRYVEKNSVSRQDLSYEFNVIQRIEVIKKLSIQLNGVDNENVRALIMNRMDAQASFINKYLLINRDNYHNVLSLLKEINSDYLPYSIINKNIQEVLFIGYCFAPYADTSGVVLSKRIDEIGLPCDVISNNMSDVREIDLTLKQISLPYIHRHFEVSSKSSFSNWNLMQNFIRTGYKKSRNHNYKIVYSRVLWPASHFLAYKIKNKNKNIKWIAEFSDPVLYDIKNKVRESKITSQLYMNKLKKDVPDNWKKYITNNLFDLTEIIPFIFADELIFTNNNQMITMINRIQEEELRQEIIKKATIKPHPTLSKNYYDIEPTLLELDKEKFNIGYFGNFYETRGLKEVYELMNKPNLISHLNNSKKQLHFSVFTNDVSLAKSLLDTSNISENIDINHSLPYFEFLNAMNKFDALIVMDAHTKEYKSLNPYLPSKLSDYLGSNAQIIAFTENDSPLDKINSEKITKLKIRPK